MIPTISLEQYISYAGNLLKCLYKRTIILQAKVAEFKIYSEIAKDEIKKSMQELIEDSITLEMETTMNYKEGFPHTTYWTELRLYINKYSNLPWNLYNDLKDHVGNGAYEAFLLYYAKGVKEDLQALERWATEVRI